MAKHLKHLVSFEPPHVREQTALPSAAEQLAQSYRDQFRSAAVVFRKGPPDMLRFKSNVGEWIIEANRINLFGDIKELRELVEWHTSPMPPLPPGRKAAYLRCPSNLFDDVCGGGLVSALVTKAADGRVVVTVVKDKHGREIRHGGLLPRIIPGFLDLPDDERQARTCEWLADQIKQPSPEHNDGPMGGRWLWYKGSRHPIPGGVTYRLLDYFWNRDYASYDSLWAAPAYPVFDDPVSAQTIRSRASDLNKILRRIGIPWLLRCNSPNRFLAKIPPAKGKKKLPRKHRRKNP